MLEFENRVVIITGASKGIGKACALDFARRGANVCIADITADDLNETKKEVEALGAKCLSFVCDISDEARVNEVVAEILNAFGKIDVLVNNAAMWRYYKPFCETPSDIWRKMCNINILGTMYFSRAVLDSMIENQYGRIINIGSVAGVYGNANMVPYSMTKGAVSSFTKALAKEVAPFGITVNNVAPGSVSEGDDSQKSELCFMNRVGRHEEFAWFISFLASDKAAYISGQDHQIDGCRKKM